MGTFLVLIQILLLHGEFTQSNRILNINSHLVNDPLCFLNGSKVAQLDIAWSMTGGRCSLWGEAIRPSAVPRVG